MALSKQETPDLTSRPRPHDSDQNALRWDRVRRRLRTEIGEDIYTSWFTRMELEDCGPEEVRLSVPTRFLRNWIQSHYVERLLALYRSEAPQLRKIKHHVAIVCIVSPCDRVAIAKSQNALSCDICCEAIEDLRPKT